MSAMRENTIAWRLRGLHRRPPDLSCAGCPPDNLLRHRSHAFLSRPHPGHQALGPRGFRAVGGELPGDSRAPPRGRNRPARSEEHTSELQSLMRISYAVFCLKKKIDTLYSQHIT